jgi:drug/metabolite transporter (DMT)-like permease
MRFNREVLTGLVFALLATVLNSAAGLMQSEATRRKGPLLTQPGYLGGLAVDGIGWICTVVALRHLPVFAVQAILGGAIAVTALATRVLYGSTLRPVDRIAVGGCLVGMVLVAGSAGSYEPASVSVGAQITLFSAAAVLGAVLFALRHTRRAGPLAVIAGLGFGGTSLAVRAIHPTVDSGLFAQAPLYLVLCFWVIGIISYTRALAVGALSLVTALYLAVEVIVPGVVGILLLGDTVRPGWQVAMMLGLLLAAVGVLVLSQASAARPRKPARVV